MLKLSLESNPKSLITIQNISKSLDMMCTKHAQAAGASWDLLQPKVQEIAASLEARPSTGRTNRFVSIMQSDDDGTSSSAVSGGVAGRTTRTTLAAAGIHVREETGEGTPTRSTRSTLAAAGIQFKESETAD